jgi:hypothetical protein
MRFSTRIPYSPAGRAGGRRGRAATVALRKAMRRAAARRRLAVALRRKPFGRVNPSLDAKILALEETALSSGRVFAWRKGDAQ